LATSGFIAFAAWIRAQMECQNLLRSECPLCAMCGRLSVGKGILMFCPSVGAAMCAACLCGTQRPLAIMPSAKTGPDQKHAL
jgi:hypothetical protein